MFIFVFIKINVNWYIKLYLILFKINKLYKIN